MNTTGRLLLFVGCVAACGDNESTVQGRLETACQSAAQCDDGLFCNGDEICGANGLCQTGSAPRVDDSIPCTEDFCDEVARVVLHVANHGMCDDNLFCNGAETCEVDVGCVENLVTNYDDGLDCTYMYCAEEFNMVFHIPYNYYCSDNNACNGEEICDVTVGCLAGVVPVVDDNIACTIDLCDQFAGVLHVPDNTLCDDGDPATADVCDQFTGCVNSPTSFVDPARG